MTRWAIALVVSAAGCSSGPEPADVGPMDMGVADTARDTETPDTRPLDTGPPRGDADLSDPCTRDVDCRDGLFCVDATEDARWPEEGFCARRCANDEQCGPMGTCTISVLLEPETLSTVRICLRSCEVESGCEREDRVCSDRIDGSFLGWPVCIPGASDASDGTPCTTFAECASGQTCLRPSSFERPGGVCATACTSGDTSACRPALGESATCAELFGGSYCLPSCTRTEDCARSDEGYTCVDGACQLDHAPPGAGCRSDDECGPSGSAWACLMGPDFPGGYCGRAGCDREAPGECPDGAVCYDPTLAAPGSGDEFCASVCSGDEDCRISEGYTCRAADPARPDLPACRFR